MTLETSLQLAADRLSNGETSGLTVLEEWIDEAGEEFKQALRH